MDCEKGEADDDPPSPMRSRRTHSPATMRRHVTAVHWTGMVLRRDQEPGSDESGGDPGSDAG
ncbi:MAG: hypothetical protein WD118_07745 [Phycisphaeraceae bacterium]